MIGDMIDAAEGYPAEKAAIAGAILGAPPDSSDTSSTPDVNVHIDVTVHTDDPSTDFDSSDIDLGD
jgi:hypothetical protein